MELDNIKLQTTWNDAAGSINNNFSKIKQAIAALVVEGGGLDEEQLLEYLVNNGYVTQEWINENGYIKEVTKKMIADSLGSKDNAGKFLMSTDGDVVWADVNAEQATPDWLAQEGEDGYIENKTHGLKNRMGVLVNNGDRVPLVHSNQTVFVFVDGEVKTLEGLKEGSTHVINYGPPTSISVQSNYIVLDDEFAYHATKPLHIFGSYRALSDLFIPNTIARVSDIKSPATPDWDAAQGAAGYIANRPFYATWYYKKDHFSVSASSPITLSSAVQIGATDFMSANVYHQGKRYVCQGSFAATSGILTFNIGSGKTISFEKYQSSLNIRTTDTSNVTIELIKTASNIVKLDEIYIPSTIARTKYVEEREVYLEGYAEELVNALEDDINGRGYLTSADIEGVDIVVDDKLSDTSTNPVQNKVITSELEDHDTRISDMESFFAEGAKLNLRINSNQSNDSVIAAVKATITYDDVTLQAGSGTIGLPPFKVITISFPDVQGYKTPEQLVFETGAVPISHTVTYETEVARITLSAYDGYSVIGSTIAIDGVSYVWNGATIEHKVPYGKTYEAEAITDIEGYIRPEETYTASQPIREIDIQYSAMVGSWIIINQTITDPAGMITGDVNGEHIRLIRQNSHRYLGKYTSNGTMTLCQLDDDDSNFYKDGSEANLDGGEGDVFVHIPKFFYAVSEKQTDVYKIGFYYGDTAPSNKWKEWSGNDLIGAFAIGGAYTPKDYPLNSFTGISLNNYDATLNGLVQKAERRGSGYMLLQWKQRRILSVLYYAQYGRTDWQNVIGYQPNLIDKKSGLSASMGMQDSTPEIASSVIQTFWGLEAFGRTEWVYKAMSVPTLEITDGETVRTYSDSFFSAMQTYYITKCHIDDNLDFAPRQDGSNGTETTGYCDWHKLGGVHEERYVCKCRGIIGLERVYYNEDEVVYGDLKRLAFRGTLVFENNSETFKSLTAIN
jgi:hypothetical protein